VEGPWSACPACHGTGLAPLHPRDSGLFGALPCPACQPAPPASVEEVQSRYEPTNHDVRDPVRARAGEADSVACPVAAPPASGALRDARASVALDGDTQNCDEPRCANGHVLGKGPHFCDECGREP
jgi:hypothetical protein